MTNSDFKVTFWGTQGSVSVSNARKERYGCNTPCVSAECGDRVFIFDMGTGLLPCSEYLLQKQPLPQTVELFLSHYHLDHIEGLPFAGLSYHPQVKVHFYGPPVGDKPAETVLGEVFSPPYFPGDLIGSNLGGRFSFDTLTPGQPCDFGGGVTLESRAVPHPGGSVSYKLSYQGKSLCYLSDYEYEGQLSTDFKSYLSGCDLTIIDAYFSNSNLIAGWGHSTWEQGVEIWREAGIKKMAMYHHHIASTDADLDELGQKLKAISPELFIAMDGLAVYL